MSENQNTIKIWANGGAGSGILTTILQSQSHTANSSDIAKISAVLVDTSRSNYERNSHVLESHKAELVLIPNVDGSGQNRQQNVDRIKPYIGNIVNTHVGAENELNIVIHSGAGGSGSVLSPLIVKELLNDNRNVLVVMVGDDTTRRYAYNTKSTLQTYEAIAQQTGKPVICRYYQNHVDSKATIQNINLAISDLITDYRVLFSGKIHSIDSADLANFFHYGKVTGTEPCLTLISNISVPNKTTTDSLLNILDKNLGNNYNIVAAVNVQSSELATRQTFECDFRVEGLLDYPSDVPADKLNSLFFVLTDNYFYDIVGHLTKVVETYDRRNQTRVSARISTTGADSDGLVL